MRNKRGTSLKDSFGSLQIRFSKLNKILQFLNFFVPSLLVIASLIAQLLMREIVGGRIYLLFYPAIFFGALIGGFWPGLTAALLASLFSWYIFVQGQSTITAPTLNDIFAHFIFSFMAFSFCVFGEILRRSQNQEREARKEAELMIEERSKLLNKLEHHDKLKNQFFANVSHELRTPLTLILGPVAMYLAKNPKEELRSLLEQVQRNSLILLQHVNDLLDVSKLEVGKMKIKYAEFDVVKTIKQIAANFDFVAQEKQFSFELRLPNSLVVQADQDKFKRIINNLLSNAFKFTPNGGIIRCSLQTHEDHGVLEVADSGVGIAEQYREKVFDRFFQIEESSIHYHEGTGLGLAIVKEFIELHGGKVKVDRSPEGGTLFTLEFPIKAPLGFNLDPLANNAVNDEQTNLSQTLPFEKLKSGLPVSPIEDELISDRNRPLVLVVEDNIEMNQFVFEVLSSEFRLIRAFNGQDGIKMAQKHQPNLIITDMMMPVLSGHQMILAIRALPDIANTPIVIISAKCDEELRIKMLYEGIQDYLTKPFTPDELRAKSRNLILASEQQIWLQTIINQIPEAIIIFDDQGKIVHLNAVAKSLARESGRMSAWGIPLALDIRSPSGEILPAEQLPVFQSFKTGKTITGAEFSVLDPHGELIPILVNATPIQTRSGKKGAVGIFQNISAFKELERLRNEWASIIAHELRQPVATISMRAEALKSVCASEISKEDIESIEGILEDTRRLDRMINDLLDLSRIEANRMSLKLKVIDLPKFTTKILDTLKSLLNGYLVHITVPPTNVFVKIDPDRFEQIMGNLISNAVKYGTRNGEILFEMMVDNTQVEVIVSNHGPGISPDQLPLLFNRFVRTKEAKSGSIKGIGLGLYVVKGLVEAHGGKIWAESTPGETTSFHFTLPLPEAQSVQNHSYLYHAECPNSLKKTGTEKHPLDDLKLLVVDDSQDMRLLLRKLLEKTGAVVTEAQSANDAILKINQCQPDLIISDIEMPDGNGYDLVERIHNYTDQKKISIPIIALTGHSDETQLKKIMDTGFNATLSKLTSRDNLIATIHRLVISKTKHIHLQHHDRP
jgi:signal transduction histidine kinase